MQPISRIHAHSTLYLPLSGPPVAESDGSSDVGIADTLSFAKQLDTAREFPEALRSLQCCTCGVSVDKTLMYVQYNELYI